MTVATVLLNTVTVKYHPANWPLSVYVITIAMQSFLIRAKPAWSSTPSLLVLIHTLFILRKIRFHYEVPNI